MQLRARVAGVQSDKLANPGELKERVQEVEEVEESGAASMLDNQFSTEADVQTNSHVGLLEQEMQKFIDQKLKGSEGDEEQVEQKKSRTDELYEVPEHLQMKIKEKSADEMLDNGAETWLTGIVEVELPMDEKLRNIEETERAKKTILLVPKRKE